MRKKLPKSAFAEPKERKYPMPDKSHAANAKSRATQMEDKGKMSGSEHAKIVAKANKVLGKGKKKVAKKAPKTKMNNNQY
jgi:hypothetical protein